MSFLSVGLRTAGVAALAVLGAAMAFPAAAEFSAAQKGEVENIIKDYLLTHPDVLRDALAEIERRQKVDEVAAREKAVTDQSAMLLNSEYQVVLGNPNGKITLVEFFDYNCGYCKRAMDDMAKMMKADPDLRIVLKDFPVLGPGSVEAAQVAGALRIQFKGDKFWEYHQKLLATKGQIGKTQALNVARELGADMGKLDKDMAAPAVKAGIDEVMRVADSLNLTGTPSYVLGTDVIVGAVGYQELQGKLDNMKKCGKSVCS